MTTRSKRSAKSAGVEAVIGQDGEMLKRLIHEALQQVLEAEMTEAVGAGSMRRIRIWCWMRATRRCVSTA